MFGSHNDPAKVAEIVWAVVLELELKIVVDAPPIDMVRLKLLLLLLLPAPHEIEMVLENKVMYTVEDNIRRSPASNSVRFTTRELDDMVKTLFACGCVMTVASLVVLALTPCKRMFDPLHKALFAIVN